VCKRCDLMHARQVWETVFGVGVEGVLGGLGPLHAWSL
jgi:hypothetical protein